MKTFRDWTNLAQFRHASRTKRPGRFKSEGRRHRRNVPDKASDSPSAALRMRVPSGCRASASSSRKPVTFHEFTGFKRLQVPNSRDGRLGHIACRNRSKRKFGIRLWTMGLETVRNTVHPAMSTATRRYAEPGSWCSEQFESGEARVVH